MRLVISLLLFLALAYSALGQPPANCRKVNNVDGRIVCVCNQNDCDQLRYEFPKIKGQGHLITTTKQGDRFKVADLSSLSLKGIKQTDVQVIKLDLSKRYQTIFGWGGAFTDATGINVKSLSEKTAARLLESYFDRDGLQYNMGRVPIGGTDFSSRGYTYDDLEAEQVDYGLEKWSLTQEDHDYKIPLIREANKLHNRHSNDNLKLFGSPWTPPIWMKDNHKLARGSLINDTRIYQAWANYQVKFYEAYRKALGFRFWGGTVQNEPVSSQSPAYFFNSLEMNSNNAAKFVGGYLGPALGEANYTRDNFKLMLGDDNINLIGELVSKMLDDELVKRYSAGLAIHWYGSDKQNSFDMFDGYLEKIKNKIEFVLMTEACAGWRKGKEPPVLLGSWGRAEQYAVDTFQDLLRYSTGWIDWNMALDMDGGPTYVNNTVDSPIIVNKQKDEFYKQPMYYIRGHFSRFFRPGSVRVDLSPNTRNLDDQFMAVAVYDDKSGVVAINMLNKHDKELIVSLDIGAFGDIGQNLTSPVVSLSPRSISTVTMKL